MASEGPVKLQQESTGVLIDKYHGKYIDCTAREGVISKAETYIYRCSVDKVCCPTGCCLPGAAGFPMWLLILILVLAFLLALLLLACLIYYCCVRRRKKLFKTEIANGSADKRLVVTGAPPRVEIYDKNRSTNEVSLPTRKAMTNDNDQSPSSSVDSKGQRKKKSASQRNKIALLRYNGNDNLSKTEHVTVLTDLESDAESGAKIASSSTNQLKSRNFSGNQSRIGQSVDQSQLRDFSGSQSRTGQSMLFEESYEKPPRPIPVSYHDQSEISVEKRPLLNRLERPEEQKARMVYYKEESSRNESFDERTEYD